MNNGLPANAGSAGAAQDVIISGDVTFAVPARAIYVGTGGDVEVVCQSRTGVTNTVHFRNFPAGKELPASSISQIIASGTSASDLVALW